MMRVMIVSRGDPENTGFNYVEHAREICDRFNEWGLGEYEAEVVASTDDALARLGTEPGVVVFVSAYFCDEALRLARRCSLKRFLVYSVGLAPVDMPKFAFRGMLNKENLAAFL
ncbi:MAG: hypothetical protein Q7R58_01100 [bacterium]|nr:hypothetical protein [bacterium]